MPTMYHEMKRIVIKKYVLCMSKFFSIWASAEKIVQSNCTKWQAHIVPKQGNCPKYNSTETNYIPFEIREYMHVTVELLGEV